MLQLQRSHGNQAVQQLVKERIQPKLEVGKSDDKYEREAGQVAERVMRMPESPTAEGSKKDEVGTRAAVSTDSVPPLVSEVLRSPGQPLDPATRRFMENRFGRDLSQVRVHTDSKATESARAVNALAYTAGRDVVFGEGQYTPGTFEGRRLLAHELAHVVQQTTASNRRRSVQLPVSSAGSDRIQRSPDKPAEVERRRDQWLEELAKWPNNAHKAWKKLNEVDRTHVVFRMILNYGESFAREFLRVATAQAYDIVLIYYGLEVGPTPDKLVTRGFQLTQEDSVHEWWVHPSGRIVLRRHNHTERKPSDAVPEEEALSEPVTEGTLEPEYEEEAQFSDESKETLQEIERILDIAEVLDTILRVAPFITATSTDRWLPISTALSLITTNWNDYQRAVQSVSEITRSQIEQEITSQLTRQDLSGSERRYWGKMYELWSR